MTTIFNNPYATFDCLAIGIRLQKLLDNFAISELHIFSYLACLLSLYSRQSVSDWNYEYTSTKEGSPFSIDLNSSLDDLILGGYISQEDVYLKVTKQGYNEYELLRSLKINNSREIYIEGACSSILTLPVSLVREAMLQEPELRKFTVLGSTRRLLEEQNLYSIYQQFSVLSAAIGIEVQELMIPATIWLTYLIQNAKTINNSF